MGGVPNARYGWMCCFSFGELKRILGIAMGAPLIGLGDRVIRVVDCRLDACCRRLLQGSYSLKRNECGPKIRKHVPDLCSTRCVDDLMVVSQMWC